MNMPRDSSFFAKSVRYNIFRNGATYCIAYVVFRIGQNHGEWSYLRKFQGDRPNRTLWICLSCCMVDKYIFLSFFFCSLFDYIHTGLFDKSLPNCMRFLLAIAKATWQVTSNLDVSSEMNPDIGRVPTAPHWAQLVCTDMWLLLHVCV